MLFFFFIQILIDFLVSKQWRPGSDATGLGLHCLFMSHKKGSRHMWVNLGHFEKYSGF